MKILACALTFALLACGAQAMERPAFHTQGTATGKPTGPLKPGEYWWQPDRSPRGPVVALVSVPQQTISVYRNGILIGRSSVSTGSAGHATPGGVFTILEKATRHYSKTYNDAPMPYMQRLTWNGVALHSGNIPGYPASHGCIRLPYDFANLLFGVTERGGTVIVGDGKSAQPRLADNPGVILAPSDFSPRMVRPLARGDYDWAPERSPNGPVSLVLSRADKAVYVYRNGNAIGRAAIEVRGAGNFGQHVFTLLEGKGMKPSAWAPDRPELLWMQMSGGRGPRLDAAKLRARVAVNPAFGAKVHDILKPGATVVVTDAPVARKFDRNLAILSN